jgi:hypothetical protein
LSVRLSAAHTSTSLFLAFDVRDQYVRAEESDATAPWYNDGVELFLDGDRVANDYIPVTELPAGTREGFQLIADVLGHRLTCRPNSRTGTGPWGPTGPTAGMSLSSRYPSA